MLAGVSERLGLSGRPGLGQFGADQLLLIYWELGSVLLVLLRDTYLWACLQVNCLQVMIGVAVKEVGKRLYWQLSSGAKWNGSGGRLSGKSDKYKARPAPDDEAA